MLNCARLALIIDPDPSSHICLRRALKSLGCEVASFSNLGQAQTLLRTLDPALILCERDVLDGSWRDLLSDDQSPLLIVTSRLADERLWSEVLHLGGFDVLAKPFDETEVMRVLDYAIEQAGRRHGHGERRTVAAGSA